MENEQMGKFFEEIAFWLEISGDNPFKIRSYASAAHIIKKLGEPAALLCQEGRLREIEGIGTALEEKIKELLATGRLAYLEKLRDQFPHGLLELSKIHGMGVRTIKQLYEMLQITSLDALREACERGDVAKLKGFGPKRQEKIREGLRFLDGQQNQFHLHTACRTAHEFLNYLQEHPGVRHAAIAGSLRRHKETVKRIELLVAGEDAPSIIRHFVAFSEVLRVTSTEQKSSTVIAKSNIPVTLKVVSEGEWPFALLHASGNKAHNLLLSNRATDLGFHLSEHGLSYKEGGPHPCKAEKDIYQALQLPFIPPELREGLYEFELPLPLRLLTEQDILGVAHCHSNWSDGVNSIEEMAQAARELGYAYLILTDHSQSSVMVNGLTPERVFAQHTEIDALNNRIEGIRIVKGIEADILGDGSLDYVPEVLDAFEFILASIHNHLEMSEEEATSRIVRAIENPYTSAIGHLTGRLLLSRPGYPVHVDKVVDAAIANGVAIEINANPRRLDMDWRHLREAADKGVVFLIGPDAHRIAGLNNIRLGVGIARKGGLNTDHVLNCKPVEEIIRWRGRK
jgi:DNA polymerase (family X)